MKGRRRNVGAVANVQVLGSVMMWVWVSIMRLGTTA